MDLGPLLFQKLQSRILTYMHSAWTAVEWLLVHIWELLFARKGKPERNQTVATIDGKGRTIYTRKVDHASNRYETADPQNSFDILSIGKRLSNNGKCAGYRPAKGQPYVWLTYQQVIDRARNFGAGLLSLGAVSGTEFLVGIFAKTCVEWTVADYGCMAYDLVVAPFYDSLGSEACVQLIDAHFIEIIVCGGEVQVSALMPDGRLPVTLRTIITVDRLSDKRIAEIESHGVKVLTVTDVENLGKQNPQELRLASSDSIASLIFTSGTTGLPKGAMISHKSFVLTTTSFLRAVEPLKLTSADTIIGYLPLAHIMERLWERALFLSGGKVGYLSGGISALFDDCRDLKPTCFAFVPRILSRLHDKIMADFNRNVIIRLVGRAAVLWKLQAIQAGDFRSDTLVDRIIFRRFRNLLGGNLRVGLTGSAAIDGQMLNFARAVFGCYIFEAYGQTEAGGPVTVTTYADCTVDHVGIPFEGVEVKLDDVPEMQYYSRDSKGEICTRAAFQMRGYLSMPEKTAETVDEDGWIHSGDIGQMTPEGKLRIIDRKKYIFKLSHGEYVAPERLEAVYGQSKFVLSIFVDGDSKHPFPVALVCPHSEELKGETERAVKSKIIADLSRLAKEHHLKSYEVPQRIYLLDEPFTVENGCLAQTQKTRREFIRTKYRDEIKKLYASA